MYIEVDIEEGLNCWPLHKMFETLDLPKPIDTVMAPDINGHDLLCQITGWSQSGPCQAHAVMVSDSGEGTVTLIYGGDQGIRLKPAGNKECWSLDNQDQWGEPCLLLDRDVYVS